MVNKFSYYFLDFFKTLMVPWAKAHGSRQPISLKLMERSLPTFQKKKLGKFPLIKMSRYEDKKYLKIRVLDLRKFSLSLNALLNYIRGVSCIQRIRNFTLKP